MTQQVTARRSIHKVLIEYIEAHAERGEPYPLIMLCKVMKETDLPDWCLQEMIAELERIKVKSWAYMKEGFIEKAISDLRLRQRDVEQNADPP